MAGKTDSTTKASCKIGNSLGLKGCRVAALALEFMAGKTDSTANASCSSENSLGLKVMRAQVAFLISFHGLAQVWMNSFDLLLHTTNQSAKNAYPRHVQTRLDLYVASMYGMCGLIVTMKMKTKQSFNGDLPDLDMQLIMEPPSPQRESTTFVLSAYGKAVVFSFPFTSWGEQASQGTPMLFWRMAM